VNLTCDAVRTELTGMMIPLLRSDPTYRLRVRAQVAELLNTINPNYKTPDEIENVVDDETTK